jgi:hypothetical protein
MNITARYVYQSTFYELFVSNNGGRSVSLIDVSPSEADQPSAPHLGSYEWAGVSLYERTTEVELPTEIPSGTTRKWLIRVESLTVVSPTNQTASLTNEVSSKDSLVFIFGNGAKASSELPDGFSGFTSSWGPTQPNCKAWRREHELSRIIDEITSKDAPDQ